MVVKGAARSARRAAAAAKRATPPEAWNIEQSGAGLVAVRERTPRQERAHQARMERWAVRYDRLNGAG